MLPSGCEYKVRFYAFILPFCNINACQASWLGLWLSEKRILKVNKGFLVPVRRCFICHGHGHVQNAHITREVNDGDPVCIYFRVCRKWWYSRLLFDSSVHSKVLSNVVPIFYHDRRKIKTNFSIFFDKLLDNQPANAILTFITLGFDGFTLDKSGCLPWSLLILLRVYVIINFYIYVLLNILCDSYAEWTYEKMMNITTSWAQTLRI